MYLGDATPTPATGTTIFSTKNIIVTVLGLATVLFLGMKTRSVYKRTKTRVSAARKEYIKRRISRLTEKL